MTNYIDYHQHLEKRLVQLGQELPGPMSGFARLHKKAVEAGALDAKTKELMALAIGIAVHCDGCIAYHTHDAVAAGATRAELLETIGVDNVMFETDFPHPTSLYPGVQEHLKDVLGGYDRTIQKKVLQDNAQRFYNLPF